MIIAIDFDGPIHNPQAVIKGQKLGIPTEGAKESLEELHKTDKIIIFTNRATNFSATKAVADFLDHFEIPYDDITNIKPNADVFIDDKAMKFINWEHIMRLL